MQPRSALPSAADLPDPVLRYAERALASAPMPAGSVRFTQVGEMQLKPGRWFPFVASQEVRVDRVEFSWRARFRIAPLLSVTVRDWYRDGAGGFEARLLGLIPVARGSGAQTARSEAMRYLAELPWFPHAIVENEELEWRQVDATSVGLATSVRGGRAAITVGFDERGDIEWASASNRPRQEGKRIVERAWWGRFFDYAEHGGVRVPTRAEVEWELPEGQFPYFRGRLLALDVG